MQCPVRDSLMDKVQEHLREMANLATQEVDLIRNEHSNTWLAVDKQIEQLLGEKERCIGALKQHRNEHGC